MSLLKSIFLYCFLLPFAEDWRVGRIPKRVKSFEEQQHELALHRLGNRPVRPHPRYRGRCQHG